MNEYWQKSEEKTPLISIIVPFYGVEKYIEACIASVKKQTFTNFECILIDDESPDNSYQIAQKTIEGDARFYIVRQKNTRQGGARNNGLNRAKGQYVTFLDSDDFWQENFLEEMLKTSKENNADMVICNYFRFFEKSNHTELTSYTLPSLVLSQEKQIREHLFKFPGVIGFFRKEVFETARYPENVFMEDFAIIPQIVSKIKKIVLNSKPLYYYRQREGSVTNVFDYKIIETRFKVFNEFILPYFQQANIEKDFVVKMYNYHIIIPLGLAVYRNFNGNKAQKTTELQKLKKRFNRSYFNFWSIFRQFRYVSEISKTLFVLAYFLSPSVAYQLLKLKR